jgi:HAD superfamily hydrolase (TIGR01549 family)
MAMRQDLTFKEFARTMCNGKLPFLYNETLMDLQQELSSIQTLPGAIELIQYLKANGVRVGVCSNLAHEYKVALELLPEFDFQVLSFEERCQKPQREIYERVIAYSECTPDEILFVGDSHQNDFLSPIKYGMDAVHLNMKEWVDRAVISHVRTRYGAAIVRDPEHYHLLFAEYHDNGPRSSS